MKEFSLENLNSFIVRAKAATWIGGGEKSPSTRPGAKDLRYQEDPYTYLDSYFGMADFIGEEVVYYLDEPVWAMNYYGRLLDPAFLSPEDVIAILRESLTLMYKEGRFLGGFRHAAAKGEYVDGNEGDLTAFHGREAIHCAGRLAYELLYHGGMIR